MSYGLYIGKNLTSNGIAYLAGYGDEPSSHWLEIIPRQEHEKHAKVVVGVTPSAELPGVLSEIPQARQTARQIRVSYSHYKGHPAPLTNGGLNEHGVAVRDIWSPSRPELISMTPTDQKGPSYSDLARIVLERARTAREGVEIIGQLTKEFGHTSYGGNSHIIADSEEAWVVIQFAGGKGLWVAERLGPDSIRASRPGYIEDIALNDSTSEKFLYSANFISFAISQGWHDPEKTAVFNVNKTYGDGKGKWEGVQWIEKEMRARADRAEKIGIEDVIWAVRTDKLTADTAGYGQVVPLIKTEYSDLRMIWHTQTSPAAVQFVPVFMGVTEIPEEFSQHRYLTEGEAGRYYDARHLGKKMFPTVPQGIESTRSATQIFKRLEYLVFQNSELFMKEQVELCRASERHLSRELDTVCRTAGVLFAAQEFDLGKRYLTYFSCTELIKSLNVAEAIAAGMEIRTRALHGISRQNKLSGPSQTW